MPKAAGSTKAKPRSRPAPAPVEEELSADDWFVGLDDVEDFTNTLLYGREGSGKTTSMARLLNIRPTGNLLVINAEGGLKKVALRKRGVDTSRIRVYPKPGERPTFRGLLHVYHMIKADLERDPESWVGVGIDSATEVRTALLDAVQEKRVTAIKNAGKAVDENHVDIADYGDMSKMFRDMLRKFRDLPTHVVITALERRDVDKDTGKPTYGPDVNPGIQSDLLGYVDFVLMCKAADEDGPFRALTRANSRYRAKDRFDVLPRVLAEPMMDRVIGYLHGDIVEDEDPFQDDLPARAKKSQDAPAQDPDEDEESEEEDDTPDA